MDFYQGAYMSYDDMPDDADPDEEVTPLVSEGAEGEEKMETQAEDTLAEEGTGDQGQDEEVMGPKDAAAPGEAKEA
ncbi:hypothetical protein Fmac_014117 [Flemingia macrophylla]|uniref:Uncharacterized protein n=1 Tax=Flemingia macrophylla TaxID=520843 RepID=A0ABD1MAS9_9FABA